MMAILATQDLFKNYLNLDPGQMTVYISIIHLPWSIKILYGLVSDNLPVFGTRRKSYIIIMGLIQTVALLYLYLSPEIHVFGVVIALTAACFTEAFVNVVADAIMVIQARKDPVNGSQNLVSFSYFSISIGSIVGCLLSGYIIQYSHPKYVYLIYSFMGLFVSFSGLCLSPISEKDTTESEEDEVDLTNIRGNIFKDFKTIFLRIKEALMMKEIYMLLLFFILNGLISPGFGNFSYYFLMNVCKITKV